MLTDTIVYAVEDLMEKGCIYVNTVDAEAICKFLIQRGIKYEVAAVGDHYRRIDIV